MPLLPLLLFLALAAPAAAQTPASPPPLPAAAQTPASPPPLPATWLQGYVRTIGGEWIAYPWAYPGQTKTLLSRATHGRMAVEWEGAPVPAGGAQDPVTYLWHAGTASGYGAHRFTLSVNGHTIATFTSGRTTAAREWSVAGENGATLSFTTTRVGRFDELFGFMWLTAPRAFFAFSAPRFRVVGEAADSQDYYLGPQESVEEWARVQPVEAVFAHGQRAVRVAISRAGAAQPVELRSGDRVLWSGQAGPGYTSALVPAGPNTAATMPVAIVVAGRTVFSNTIAATGVRTRSIHLLPHSHIDIGYSDPQPEVEKKQWKNLGDAVALARATSSYPAEARFKWNVEGLWSVESYLAQASAAERQVFADAVRAGTIGLQANYTNVLTGLMTPGELHHWTDASRRIAAQLGVPAGRSVMQSDIPGVSWAAVQALASDGVTYFSSGPNYMPGSAGGGDRIGATLEALGDRPFWWASPSGTQRLLFWMAGRGYSWFHGLNTGAMSETSRDAILDYVKTLADSGYRYDMIQVRYTIGGDNGPVDPNLPEFVKRWNETFASPRLVINTADAMFAEFEQRHGAELPVMAGDMTPYWEDGAISSAHEESLVRGASRRVAQAETLAALTHVTLPADRLQDAWRNILLWHEHTWGAADSISQPDRPDVVAQWEYKKRFADEADRLSRALLAAAGPNTLAGGIEVVNTLAWARAGLVLLAAEQSATGDRVIAGGAPVPSQRLRDGRLAAWVRVPASASVRLRVVRGAPKRPARTVVVTGDVIDNGLVRVGLDANFGALTSLAWGDPRQELVSGEPGLFRYLYVAGVNPADGAGSSGGTLSMEDGGPLVATARIDSPAGGARSSVRRFRVVAGSVDVFAEIELDKTSVRSKESGHLSFPFQVPDSVIRVAQGGTLVQVDRDQLPGSCRDFIGVQSAIDVSGPSFGVSLASIDAPLVELGAITDERRPDGGGRTWREYVTPGTTLYSYLFNNYWHTNYKADQPGRLRLRYVLRPHRAFDPTALRRFSDEQDSPLLVFGSGR